MKYFTSYQTLLLSIILCLIFTGCTSLGMRDIPEETLRAKYTNEQSRYIDIDGIKVHYRDEGEGPVLVLAHGMMSSLHTWNGFIENLEGSYRIIRLDLPAFGFTNGFETDEYTVGQYVEFLHKFFQKIGVDRFSMMGNSIGGYLSWSYAAKYPEEVESVVLFAAPAYPQDIPFVLKLATMPGSKWTNQHFWPRFIVKWGIKQVYGDKEKVTSELVDRYFELMIRPGSRVYQHKLYMLMKRQSFSEPEGIPAIQAPVLVVWGQEDPWVPSNIERWKKDLPCLEYIEYEGVGHVPMEEIPQQTAKDIEDFLKANGIGRIADNTVGM